MELSNKTDGILSLIQIYSNMSLPAPLERFLNRF
mgnify:CR=1 FL=1